MLGSVTEGGIEDILTLLGSRIGIVPLGPLAPLDEYISNQDKTCQPGQWCRSLLTQSYR